MTETEYIHWELAMECSADGAWSWNIETNEVLYTLRWKEMLGYKDEEIGECLEEWSSRIHPDDIDEYLSTLGKYTIEVPTKFYEAEYRMLCKNGSYKWVLNRSQVTDRNTDGTPKQIIGIHQDISKQKELEKVLIQEKKQKQALAESSSAGVWTSNPKSKTETYSDRYAEIFGYNSEEEFLTQAKSWKKIIHPDDLPAVKKGFEQHVKSKGKTPFSQVVRYTHKKGHTVWVICSGKVTDWNENGEAIHVIGCHIDVTDVYETRDKLDRLTNLFNLTNRLAKVGGWEYDLRTERMKWTQITNEIHETSLEYVPTVDESVLFYTEGESRESIISYLNSSITTGDQFELDLEIKTAKGNLRWIRTVAHPEMQRDECIRIYGSIQDITEMREIRNALIEKVDKFRELYETSINEAESSKVKPIVSPIVIPANKTFTNQSILIVEDSKLNQIVISKLLNKLGLKNYEICQNGKEAVDKVKQETYDFILMDCQMPVMDGYEATKAIRLYEKEVKIKTPTRIIGLSAGSLSEDSKSALNVGMDQYVMKPIRIDKLKALFSEEVLCSG